ncbi:MAG: DUF4430 domain-containing protein [Patescibacteria group bacterium]
MRTQLVSFLRKQESRQTNKNKSIFVYFSLLDPRPRISVRGRFWSGMTVRCVTALLIASSLIPSLSLQADAPLSRAITYLKSKPAAPWATMALVAAGDTEVPAEYLKTADTSSAITMEAPILAIVAAGYDPRTFTGIDLVAKLNTFHTNGQIGDPALLNDDIFGILALSAAGEASDDPAIQDAKTTLLNAQQENGSWGDTNTTAAAIQALIEAGVAPSQEPISRALLWLKGTQNEDGGFPYFWPANPYTSEPDPSDTSSSAWVAHAVRKAGQDPASSAWEKNGKDALDHLLALQQPNGSFAHSSTFTDETSFTPISTAYAVIALAGKSLPVASFVPEHATTVSYRIEGSLNPVCTGTAALAPQLASALDIIPAAASACGFTYDIPQTSFGPYVKTINNDAAQGTKGWLYRVNWALPDRGAADYALAPGDEVLWYYGEFEWSPLRLSASTTRTINGQSANITIQQFSNNSWSPIAATLYGGTEPIQTDAQGEATITLSDGVWTIWAEADGAIRSNRVTLTIGDGNAVGLLVYVVPAPGGGNADGVTLGFTVEPSLLDFGNVPQGRAADRTLLLRNTGDAPLSFTSAVRGDELFVDNLRLSGSSWRSFDTSLNAQSTQTVEVALSVPSGNETGVSQGTLVFWGQAQ